MGIILYILEFRFTKWVIIWLNCSLRYMIWVDHIIIYTLFKSLNHPFELLCYPFVWSLNAQLNLVRPVPTGYQSNTVVSGYDDDYIVDGGYNNHPCMVCQCCLAFFWPDNIYDIFCSHLPPLISLILPWLVCYVFLCISGEPTLFIWD